MNLRRQLLLVSLLTLMLPWAGCQFIRETESALRSGQQQMLAGTARALATTLSQYAEEFPPPDDGYATGDQLYLHRLATQPSIDGYFDDWSIGPASLRTLRGTDGSVRLALGTYGGSVYLFVEVTDRSVVYASSRSAVIDEGSQNADRVTLISSNPPYLRESITFAAEAPGRIVSFRQTAFGIAPEPTITAHWQDWPGGYRIEARIPTALVGTHLGLTVTNTNSASERGTRSSSFTDTTPGPAVRLSSGIERMAAGLVQEGMRLLVTDARGWRLTAVGAPGGDSMNVIGRGFTRRIYDLLVESGEEAAFAEPDPLGREQEPYISAALDGRETATWFRSGRSGRAIVAVAAPIVSGDSTLGAVVLQQGTDAILSLTNEGLARLINLTLIATLVVATALLGYASWLSRRIRKLSVAAEAALEHETLQAALPSALAGDEIGDLSRSFSYVLGQLGDYNDYLRTLASKLSHELRTPLAIVTSSLENLEHEPLSKESIGYTRRAREGAERLRNILNAMSEASRVEELMANVEPEDLDLADVLRSTVDAYRDVYKNRLFELRCNVETARVAGSPELIIQMLDKLVDNAVDFSADGDTIEISLDGTADGFVIGIMNPGPPLPEKMRTQLFDSMVSMRAGEDDRHLGLGLYVARLIAVGHGGSITADNVDGGAVFRVTLPQGDRTL